MAPLRETPALTHSAASLKALIMTGPEPATLVRQLNRVLLENTPANRFATLFYGDPQPGCIDRLPRLGFTYAHDGVAGSRAALTEEVTHLGSLGLQICHIVRANAGHV